MFDLNIRTDFYTVCRALQKPEYFVAPDDIVTGDDVWLYNNVQLMLTADGYTWRIITDELIACDTAYATENGSGANITFVRGTPEDLSRLAVLMRLTHEI